MPWSLITADVALARLMRGARGLDVRSEGEFAQGSLPSFANVPVLNNEHRHLVGLTYKQRGPSRAITLGHELVEPLRASLVERWRAVLDPMPPPDRLLICWRGGLRSSSSADALAAAGVDGVRVEGGYKAMRGVLLRTLANPPPFVTLTGPTGSGKTQLLREFSGALDLEGLARHRGSAFGGAIDAAQPPVQTFENAVGFHLLERTDEVLVEDESAMIGQRVVPPAIRARICAGPTVELEVDVAERARRSFEDYVLSPSRTFGRARAHAHLVAGLRAVQKRLGGLRAREITDAVDRAFTREDLNFADFEEPITRLLAEYYDPLYARGQARHPRPVLFRGGRDDVRRYLSGRGF